MTEPLIDRSRVHWRATAPIATSNAVIKGRASGFGILPTRLFLVAGALMAQAASGAEPAARPNSERVDYTVQRGDTITSIAEQLVGFGRWGIIRRMNPGLDIQLIQPNRVLRLPVDRLRAQPTTARVVTVVGQASVDGQPIAEGMQIEGGRTLRVNADGFMTLELASGARVRVSGGSVVALSTLTGIPAYSSPREVLRLDAGRIETSAPKIRGPAARFEITTPTATAAVRGTTFRVGAEPASTLTEVIEGTVAVAPAALPATSGRAQLPEPVGVPAGFGLRADAGRPLAAPRALAPAPDLARIPALFERPLVRFAVPAAPGTGARVRARVASDAGFERVIAQGIYSAAAVEFRGLADGEYRLAVRAITDDGLEGVDAQTRFTLAARPEPPFSVEPAPGAKLRGDQVRLAWTQVDAARGYVVQVASDGAPAAFATPVAEREVAGGSISLPLAAGNYAWRVATVDAAGRRGPFSDPQSFSLAPLPPGGGTPESGSDATTLTLRWPVIDGHRYHWQFAGDAGFAAPLAEADVDEARATLPKPAPGQYFARVQAIDRDGVRGAYGTAQRIAIAPPPPPPPPPPIPWWPLLLLLVFFL